MTLYSLIQNKETSEVHIFKSEIDNNGKCKLSEKESICEGVSYSKEDKVLDTCLDEYSARMKCAELGRKVCGTCVSSLYKTDDDLDGIF